MTDLTFPHCSEVLIENAPPRQIIHAYATIPQFPASAYASEREVIRRAVAKAVGDRREYDDAIIHWMDDKHD